MVINYFILFQVQNFLVFIESMNSVYKKLKMSNLVMKNFLFPQAVQHWKIKTNHNHKIA